MCAHSVWLTHWRKLSHTAPYAPHSVIFPIRNDSPWQAVTYLAPSPVLCIQEAQKYCSATKYVGSQLTQVCVFLFSLKINFYWSIVALQCCVSSYCRAKWISHTCTYIPSFGFHSFSGHCRTPVASLMTQLVKNLPAVRETWVRSLGWENPLEKGKATCSSILAWRLPWTVYSTWGCKESDMTERLSQSTEWRSLHCTVGSHFLSVNSSVYLSSPISKLISPLSHPFGVHRFVLYICLYFCFADKTICIIFLDSTYMDQYTIFVFVFLTYFTLYDRL